MTASVEDIPMFKDPVNKRLEALYMVKLCLVDPTLQLAIAAVSIYKTLDVWSKIISQDPRSILIDPSVHQRMELILWPYSTVLMG